MNQKYTKQTAFNKIWQHATAPGAVPAVNENVDCVYRTSDGNRCFIGALIPDEEYELHRDADGCSTIELKSIGTLFVEKHPVVTKLFDDTCTMDFLERLQGIHDVDSPELWKSELTSFAESHNLTIPAS